MVALVCFFVHSKAQLYIVASVILNLVIAFEIIAFLYQLEAMTCDESLPMP